MTRDFRLIGPGRAGLSMATALSHRGWHWVDTLGRGDDVTSAASGVEVVVLAVPDDALAPVAATMKAGPAAIVHLSGAKTLEVFGHHQRRGSLHPLVSLPDPEIGTDRLLGGVTLAVAGDPVVWEMATAISGRIIEVDEADRSLYHATAAVAANHLVVLCAQVEALAERLGLPVEVYWELMTSTLANVTMNGARASLTGPAARGDIQTLAAHLEALTEAAPDEVELYRALATRAGTLGDRS